MPTLLCRRCNQTLDAEIEVEGRRTRCPACSMPMVAPTVAKFPKVVELRDRKKRSKSTEAANRKTRRRLWQVGAALTILLASALGILKLVIDATDRRAATAGKLVFAPSRLISDAPRKFEVTQPVILEPLTTALDAGAEAVLVDTDPLWLWLARDQESCEPLLSACRKHDPEAVTKLADNDKIFRESAGTRVVIKSASGEGYWVRVREGKNLRSVGWIPRNLLGLPTNDKKPKVRESGSPFRPGDIVELTGDPDRQVFLAVDEKSLTRLRSGSRVGLGEEVFSVGLASRAEVREVRPDRLRVRLDDLFRNGREGWINTSEVRLLPTDLAMEADVVDGLGQAARRQIFLALRAMDRDFSSLSARGVVDETAVVDRGRADIIRRFNIDLDQLKRIDREGYDRRWPTAAAKR